MRFLRIRFKLFFEIKMYHLSIIENTNGENGFHKVAPPKNGGGGTVSSTAPIVKRRQQQQHDQNNTEAIKTNLKNQYRCSLINLEETQDEELDAILGELSILESQFQEEIEDNSVAAHPVNGSSAQEPTTTTNKQPSPVASVASSNSRSSPTSSSDTAAASNISSSSKKQSNIHSTTTTNSVNGKRTESPDTDSAFCDNLSVLSSCSTSSR